MLLYVSPMTWHYVAYSSHTSFAASHPLASVTIGYGPESFPMLLLLLFHCLWSGSSNSLRSGWKLKLPPTHCNGFISPHPAWQCFCLTCLHRPTTRWNSSSLHTNILRGERTEDHYRCHCRHSAAAVTLLCRGNGRIEETHTNGQNQFSTIDPYAR